VANSNLIQPYYYLLILHAVDPAGTAVIRRKSIAARLLGARVRIRIDEGKKVFLFCVFRAVWIAASATIWSLFQRSPIGYGCLIVCDWETSSMRRLGPSISETDNDNLDIFSHPPALNSNTRTLDFWSSVLSTSMQRYEDMAWDI